MVWFGLRASNHEAKILGPQLILALAVADVSIESSRYLQPAANLILLQAELSIDFLGNLEPYK